MKLAVVALLLLPLATPARAAPAPTQADWCTLDGQTVAAGNPVGDDGRIRDVVTPVLHLSRTDRPGPQGTVLLCPGGAYKILEVVNEGARTAATLNGWGYDVAMLEYHVKAGAQTRDLALADIERAWQLLTNHARDLGLQDARLVVMGYSAGGHLAARLVQHVGPGVRPPDDLVLLYPAYLDQRDPGANAPSVQPPVQPRTRLIALMAANDRPAWLQGCRQYAAAWQQAGGFGVFHELADGGHGFGMKPDLTGEAKQWPEELAYLLDNGPKPGVGPFNTHLPWFLGNQRNRLATFQHDAALDRGAVVFLGDSITAKWNLSAAFAGFHAANRGISGDTTRGMLCRLQDTVLSLRPRVIVFMGGINDLTGQPRGTPATIAANVRGMLERIQAAAPQTPVLLCETLPSKGVPDGTVRAANAAVDEVSAVFPQAHRIRTHAAFLNPDGTINLALFVDGTHPNPAGYAIWGNILAAELQKYARPE